MGFSFKMQNCITWSSAVFSCNILKNAQVVMTRQTKQNSENIPAPVAGSVRCLKIYLK